MGHHLLIAARQKQQLYRLGDRRLGRDVHECAFVHECRVQGGEGPVIGGGVLAQMLANEILPMRDDVGQTLDIVKEGRREGGLEKPIEKDQPVSGLEHQKGTDVVELWNTRWRSGELERALGDRRDAGKAPRLLLHVWETQTVKAGDAAFAQILKPVRRARRAVGSPSPI